MCRRLPAAGPVSANMYISVYIDGMSRRYSIAEARSRLPGIIDEAEAGREVELTRRGKPVAVVVSIREIERLRGTRPRFSQTYAAFLGKHAPDEIGLDKDFPASVRDRSRGRETTL
jgi:prevent-host-death family protein